MEVTARQKLSEVKASNWLSIPVPLSERAAEARSLPLEHCHQCVSPTHTHYDG